MRVGRQRPPRRDVVALPTLSRYTWLTWLAIGGAYLLDRRVPALGPVDFAFPATMNAIQPAGTPMACLPDDPAAGRAGALVLPHGAALRRHLREVAGAHLDEVFKACRGLVGRGMPVLWAMATDQATAALWRVGRSSRGDTWAADAAIGVLPGVTPPFVGEGRFERASTGGGPVRRRQTCCRYLTMGGQACACCPRCAQGRPIRQPVRGSG
ncbi:hypothetical protein [Rugosimonospora africana]|nr:hypothetical protein [Rugosimonospora africana]